MATYYVAPAGSGGSDSNNGAIGTPFLTLAHAVTFLTPGDTLNVRAGTYAESLIDAIPAGTSGNLVTITGFAGDATPIIQPTSGSFVIETTAHAFLKIANLILDGTSLSGGGAVVKLAYTNGSTYTHDNLISGCEIRNGPTGIQGILISCGSNQDINQNNRVTGCTIHNNGGVGSNQYHGIYTETNNNTFDNNTIFNNCAYGIQVFASSATPGTTHFCSGNKIYNNIIHGEVTRSGIVITSGVNNQVYNNVLYSNSDAGVYVSTGADQTKLWNNTVYGNAGTSSDSGIQIDSGVTNTTVQNNISFSNGSGGTHNYTDSGTGTIADHNLFGTDPLFVNAGAANFQLQSTSPARDAGTSTAPTVTTDANGVSRPQGWSYDIGAYEFLGTTAYTTSQNGPWSSKSTWGGVGPPGVNDTATVQHVVTVDVNVDTGNSPGNSTAIVLTVVSAGSLTVNPGIAFIVRGNVNLNAAVFQIGTTSGGATLTLDASQSVSPTTNYAINCGTSAGQTTAKVVTRGTAASRSIVTSGVGGGNFSVVASKNDTGNYDCQYTDFSHVGTASIDSFINAISDNLAVVISWDNCTFNLCGRVNTGNTLTGLAGYSFTNCSFTNCLNASNHVRALSGAGTGTRQMKFCAFDASASISISATSNVVVEDSLLALAYSFNGGVQATQSFQRNFVRKTFSSALTFYGGMTDCYVMTDNQTGNPHFISPQIDATFLRIIMEYPGPAIVDGGDGIYGGGVNVVVQNCIVPTGPFDPSSLSTNLGNWNPAGTFQSLHNTYYAGGEGGHTIGDLSEGAGTYPVAQSNLGWVQNGFSAGALGPFHFYSAHNSANPTLDTLDEVTATGCHHNAAWNLAQGYANSTQFPGVPGAPGVAGIGYVTNTSTALGLNDVLFTKGSGLGPKFKDSSRNFGTWAVSRGSTSNTYAGQTTDGLAMLQANPWLIANSLLPWISDGYTPRSVAIKGAGHDGGTIGAMPYQPYRSRREQYRRGLSRTT